MGSNLFTELLAILVLVLANGFFALAEFSIIAARSSRLANARAKGKSGAAAAEKIRSKPEAFLASIQVGITLVGALLGVFSGATIVAKLERLLVTSSIPFISGSATTISIVSVVIGITVLSVVVGELMPKYIAISAPETYARRISGPISIFIKITAPFSRLLSWIAGLLVKLVGLSRKEGPPPIGEDEINHLLTEGRRHGVFDDEERQFVRSVFEFTDSTVRRAMTPRTDVVALELNCPSEKVLATIVENGYSRYPVYDKTIDHVVGVIYTKDLIRSELDIREIDIRKIIREPAYVPDSMPLPRLLREFRKGKYHLAIVLDEFGGTAGVISLEDVIEELIGEIQDEYDTEAAPLVKHSHTVAYANGDVWPGAINELINTHLPEDDNDTLAGLFMDTTGRLPEKHDQITVADTRLTVLAIDDNRILRLKLEKLAAAAPPE